MTMIPDKDIQAALNQMLADEFPNDSVAWENVNFNPTQGAPYLRTWFLPASPEVVTLGIQPWMERVGIFQVDCFYPTGRGWAAAKAKAAEIVKAFYAGASFVYNGLEVRISRSWPDSGRVEDGWYHIPVSIQYSAFSNER